MFEFLSSVNKGRYNAGILNRLELRHKFIVDRFRSDISGSRVLDLGSHDGRWCYAFAQAGASAVVGIEGRENLVADFAKFPDNDFKKRVQLKVDDVFNGISKLIDEKQQFDVVGNLGIYYHIMDHFGLLKLIHQLRPKLVIVDSVFLVEKDPIIRIGYEETANDLASISQIENQKKAVIGVASQSALEHMAGALDFNVEWLSWDTVPKKDRIGVEDYYRAGRSRRFTCALRPGPQSSKVAN
jgi:hypothetical protein